MARPAGAPACAVAEHSAALPHRRGHGEAQRAFFQHRKATRDGLILPVRPELAEPPANQNCTNENTREPDRPPTLPAPAEPHLRNCTNELSTSRHSRPAPDPLAALRARLDRLLDGPGPGDPEEWDLIAAIRALKLPGAPPYRGAIDPGQLGQVLTEPRLRCRRPRLAGRAAARAWRARAGAMAGQRLTGHHRGAISVAAPHPRPVCGPRRPRRSWARSPPRPALARCW